MYPSKILNSVDSMLGYWDADQRCQFANAAYEKWFGKPPHLIVGRTLKDLLGPLYELNVPHIQSTLAGEVQVFERAITCSDGVSRHTLASYFPDISNGLVQGFSVQAVDVSRLKQVEAELRRGKMQAEQLAARDFLTGLPNRVRMLDTISEACEWALRNDELVGVVSLDLDRFKAINDSFGHDFGDQVLKQVAQRMQHSVRGIDTIMRWGGDEFILLVNGLDTVEGIQMVTHRLLKAISQPLLIGNELIDLSFGCGLAIFPSHATTASELLSASDSALYMAKRMGEGRIFCRE